jgi:prevent-host-death family protein
MSQPAKAWTLADAKAHLSEVVESALKKGPQVITRHDRKAVVVVAAAPRCAATPGQRCTKLNRWLISVRDDHPSRDPRRRSRLGCALLRRASGAGTWRCRQVAEPGGGGTKEIAARRPRTCASRSTIMSVVSAYG